MSRCYEITIGITGHESEKVGAIINALQELEYEAEIETFGSGENERIQVNSESINIAIGHSEESVSREIHEAVWKANGAFCEVTVGLRDLDADIPVYNGSSSDYDNFIDRNRE